MGKEKRRAENPKNCYRVGDSWMIEFVFRGERYRENADPVSRTVAKERASSRKSEAAKGELIINGQRWNGREWVPAVDPNEVEDLLFDAALEKYLDCYKANRGAYTYRKYATPAANALMAAFEGKPLSQISPFLVEKFKLDRKAAGKSEITINRSLTFLRSMFNKCIDWNFARSNPFRAVVNGKVQKIELYREKERTRYLSQTDAARLLAACNPDLRVLVLAALHTGFRESELKALKWGNVDFVNESVTITGNYTKNNETRTVPLSEDLFVALKEAKESRNASTDDPVFVRADGAPWKSWRTAFQNALERAKISDFRWHDLRHCYGSWLAMSGTTGKAAMELMGHKDPKMTMRYTHLSMEYKRQAVAKLPRLDAKADSPQISPSAEAAKVVGFRK